MRKSCRACCSRTTNSEDFCSSEIRCFCVKASRGHQNLINKAELSPQMGSVNGFVLIETPHLWVSPLARNPAIIRLRITSNAGKAITSWRGSTTEKPGPFLCKEAECSAWHLSSESHLHTSVTKPAPHSWSLGSLASRG